VEDTVNYTVLDFAFFAQCIGAHRDLHAFPTRRSSDLDERGRQVAVLAPVVLTHVHRIEAQCVGPCALVQCCGVQLTSRSTELRRSEEHTSELQSRSDLVCRLLLEKKKNHPSSRSSSPS